MLLNSWSIALLICSAGVLFTAGLASCTALKVLFYWDAGSDSENQIELEGQTWLSAALVQYSLIIQVISLVLLVLAAEEFADMIAGAMCATGSLLANEYGSKILYAKIAGIFLYGFWIVLHQLDIRSEYYPLIQVKYIYLLVLVPLLVLDSYWLVNYLTRLEPDIITSCCGVVFSDSNIKGNFISISLSMSTLVSGFYVLAVTLLIIGCLFKTRICTGGGYLRKIFFILYGGGWLFFLLMSFVVITLFFSSYIYAMPSHNCPFDMLKSQYYGIGYPIYLSLFWASFLAASGCLTELFRNRPGLSDPVFVYQNFAIPASVVLLLIFLCFVTYPLLAYQLAGGET